MILPPLQVPPPTSGSTTACDCGGSGSGTKSQSPAHVSATGRCAIWPTLNCRRRGGVERAELAVAGDVAGELLRRVERAHAW